MSRAADVVEDDEIGVLRLEHRALALEALLAVLGAEGDEHLARALALAERAGDVGGRLELDRPAVVVLRPLGRERRRRPVVGDGGGEQRDVDVRRARARRRASTRRSASGSSRRRDGAGTARLAASRITSAPRRRASSASATPIRPDERLPTKRTLSSGSRVPPAVTSTRRPASDPRREQLLGARGDLGRARPAGRRPTRPRPSRPRPGRRARRRARAASRRSRASPECAHMRGFIAGATSTGPRCASAASVSTLSAIPCASFASVFAVHGRDDEQVGARQVRVRSPRAPAGGRARGRSRAARSAPRPA